MKRTDLYFAVVMLAIFLPFFISPELYAWYKGFNAEHAMIMAFLKFGILATLGEMLGCRISTGNYTTPTFGNLYGYDGLLGRYPSFHKGYGWRSSRCGLCCGGHLMG